MDYSKLTQREIRRLAKYFLASRDRLYQAIIATKGVGSKTYYNTIIRQLNKELKKLLKYSTEFINTQIPEEYRAALDDIYRYFRRNKLLMRSPNSFALLHTDKLYQIQREAQYAIAEGLAAIGRQVQRYADTARDDALRSIGLEQTMQKETSGGTTTQMAESMLKQMQDEGFFTVQYGDGRQVPADVYASMVARSTTREAGNSARITQMEANGYDLMKMTEHYPTCGVCAMLQGRVYSVSGNDDRFPALYDHWSREYCNVHPNCFVSGTPIFAKGVMAHSSRDYVGKITIVEIAGDHKLTVTPNHPILTPEGWVAAGLLKEGDKVCEYGRIDDFLFGKNPNDIKVPTSIEDIPRTLRKSLSVTTCSVEGATEQFHGDGVNGKVAVINTYGFLRCEANSVFDKKVTKSDFIGGFKTGSFFDALCSFGSVFKSAFRATYSIVSSFGKGLTFFRRHPCKANAQSFGTVGGRHDTCFAETLMNSHFANAELTGDVALRHTGVVKGDDFVNWQSDSVAVGLGIDLWPKITESESCVTGSGFDSGFATSEDGRDLFDSLSGEIKLLDVISVNIEFFHGKVYNLQTETGWYLADNIITQNCRHAIVPWIESLRSQEERDEALKKAKEPFTDPRSEKEKELYNKQQAQKRRWRNEMYQYERYRERLGDDAPKTLAEFRRIKRADGEAWKELEKNYRVLGKPLTKGVVHRPTQASIDKLVNDELSGIRFSAQPQYSPRLKSAGLMTMDANLATGEVTTRLLIGPQSQPGNKELINTILHEEIEARIAFRGTPDYNIKGRSKELVNHHRHQYIERLIKRFFKAKGW